MTSSKGTTVQPGNTTAKKNRRRRITIFILLALFVVAVFIFSTVVNSEALVSKLGEHNGYIITFVVAFFAGFSAFTAFSFYGIMITMLSGGLNPFLLAIVVGISLALGDMFMFYFGRKGRDMLYGRAEKLFDGLSNFFLRPGREKYIPVFAYIYISFVPLPNDWLLLFLASIRSPHRIINLVIIAGDITHAAVLTFLISQGIVIVQ